MAKIENGKVTGVAAGSATLTAEVLGKKVTVTVTVTEDKPDVKPKLHIGWGQRRCFLFLETGEVE